MKQKVYALFGLLLIASLVLTACATAAEVTPTQGPAATQPPAEPVATEPAAPTEPAATEDTGAAEPTAAATGDTATGDQPYAGTTVTIFGVAADEQARLFQAEFDAFTERTGITVEYEGNKDFETLIVVRVEGGNAPDIAQFAQPGLVANFMANGNVVDLNTFMADELEGNFSQGLLDLATMDGQMAGVWHNADVKSLVWYPKAAFEEAGYEVPTTWDEMIALSDQIVADGGTPWCIGMESAGATGWVGTDWVEDIMLRTTTPENYDAWTRGELKFDSPEVRNAFEIMDQIWGNEDYVYGGDDYILTTPFGDAMNPMFDNPPKCFLHRQASFITNFFPEGTVVGEDVDYFYLPPIDETYGSPVLGSGSLSVMFNDRPEVREVMKFLATGESMKVEAEAGVAVAPHLDADPAWYPNEATAGFAEIIQNATTFRFDGSDLMPGAVGAGSFWKGIVDWVNGTELDQVLQEIDASWPAE